MPCDLICLPPAFSLPPSLAIFFLGGGFFGRGVWVLVEINIKKK